MASARIDIDGISLSPDHYIGGARVASPTTFETRCPFEWSRKLAVVARGDAATAGAACAAASAAFPSWAALTPAAAPPPAKRRAGPGRKG